MKVILSLVLVALFCSVGVKSQCSKLVRSYFNCNNNLPAGANTQQDTFWQTELSPYTNLDEANEFFKKIYTELKGCTTEACTCIQGGISSTYNYESYFLDAERTKDVNRVTNAVRNKYELRTAQEVNNDPFSQPATIFVISSPSLNDFCLKYDWSHESYYFYSEGSLCKRSYNVTYYLKCVIDSTVAGSTPEKAQEAERRCYVSAHMKCDDEMKHLLGLVEIAQYPDLIKGSLYDYSSYIAGLSGGSNGASNRFEFALLPMLISSLIYFFIF